MKMNEEGYMAQLEGLIEMGLIGQEDIEKMMKKATGGLWLDAEQQAQLETAMATYMGMIDSLHAIGIISDARIESTKKKTRKAVSERIKDGATVTENGTLEE
jgi:hypothetical protein